MGLFSFVAKQFVDVIEWDNQPDGQLMWRVPFTDNEIQYGAQLTVRDTQTAVFVNEGHIADVFPTGLYTLETRTLPVLTNLKNWDKFFASPFKSDVFFFSTRLQLGRKWGTPQPITIRDSDFGMVRLRAFGMYAYKLVDAKKFYSTITGANDSYSVEQLEPQLRNLIVANISTAIAGSGVPFLDMAANQGLMADKIKEVLKPLFVSYGLELDSFVVENVSLPEELQKALDTRISMGMMGDLNQYTQYQTATAIPLAAQNEGGMAGVGASMAAGMAMGQAMAGAMNKAFNPAAVAQSVLGEQTASAAPASDDPTAKLEKLKGLLDKGLISQADYDTAKADVLKKLLG
ncbi:SPFH domain-containing protein [Agitococcus lubricus]|uniref:Membrane protease subunit (Stomatin/prohibitin family) n=1 Tax=Agitococcus lubricus TaxID=1077255 RepID=A0A2T5J1A6_9GAMM|nr:SPFH domain-containing protein [Agitococcus lubricus]PTQ90175.1 membrane protease subunit (stomatin/prohibitin family) [Agitococcus lubricus]